VSGLLLGGRFFSGQLLASVLASVLASIFAAGLFGG
jgi:hypothetical protein